MSFQVSPDEVLLEWRQRESLCGAQMRRGRLVQQVVGGEMVMPLPSSATPEEKASIANFIDITVSSNAQRIRSVSANVRALSARPGFEKHDNVARDQRRAALDMRRVNRLQRKQGRRAREYVAFGSTCRLILPSSDGPMAHWSRRDPLAALPGFLSDPDDVVPPDIICTSVRSWRWLLKNYPDEAAFLYVGKNAPGLNDLFDMVEYLDHEQHLLMIVGRPDESGRGTRRTEPRQIPGVYYGLRNRVFTGPDQAGSYGRHEAVVLRHARNLAGVPLGVVPGRTGLDLERRGMVDGQVPLYFRMQRLTALWDEAIDRGVYPEEWLVNPNGEARVIVQADGREGTLGEITNGTIVTRDLNPGYQTPQAISQLERMLRIEGPLPAEATGESPSNVRTARRGSEIMSATLDFDLAETQDTFADADRAELECAAAVMKGYFGGKSVSFYVPSKEKGAAASYRPADLFEHVAFDVSYPSPGADANDLYLRNIQKVGAKTMSRRTAMEMDGDLEDVEGELDTIVADDLEEALLAGLKQQAAAGQIPPSDVAAIMKLVRTNQMSLALAVEKVHEDAQKRQATQVEPTDPAAQPGIALPGAGAEATPAGPAAKPSLADLLSSLPRPGAAPAPAGV